MELLIPLLNQHYNYMQKKYNNIEAIYHNSDPFEKGVIEISVNKKEIGVNTFTQEVIAYVHSENPLSPQELFINFTNGKSIYSDKENGVKLKDFIDFLQNLEKEEIEARKLNN